MSDQHFDDLIEDSIEPKNSKTKSFLTLIALAIVVLIIAIILTKIILKDPNMPVLDEDNDTVLISPDLTLQATIEDEDIKKPLIPTTEEIKPEVHIDTKPTAVEHTSTPKEAKETVKPIETVHIGNTFDENTKTNEQTAALQAKKAAQEKQAQERAKALELKKQQKAHKAQALKKAQAEQKALELKKAQARKEAQKAQAEAKKAVDNAHVQHPYFIQVGSFSKTPSQHFLNVIKKSGFHYQITAPSSKGTKKLLIGPYTTKPQVDAALGRVKDRINKSAYIIRK